MILKLLAFFSKIINTLIRYIVTNSFFPYVNHIFSSFNCHLTFSSLELDIITVLRHLSEGIPTSSFIMKLKFIDSTKIIFVKLLLIRISLSSEYFCVPYSKIVTLGYRNQRGNEETLEIPSL